MYNFSCNNLRFRRIHRYCCGAVGLCSLGGGGVWDKGGCGGGV